MIKIQFNNSPPLFFSLLLPNSKKKLCKHGYFYSMLVENSFKCSNHQFPLFIYTEYWGGSLLNKVLLNYFSNCFWKKVLSQFKKRSKVGWTKLQSYKPLNLNFSYNSQDIATYFPAFEALQKIAGRGGIFPTFLNNNWLFSI